MNQVLCEVSQVEWYEGVGPLWVAEGLQLMPGPGATFMVPDIYSLQARPSLNHLQIISLKSHGSPMWSGQAPSHKWGNRGPGALRDLPSYKPTTQLQSCGHTTVNGPQAWNTQP